MEENIGFSELGHYPNTKGGSLPWVGIRVGFPGSGKEGPGMAEGGGVCALSLYYLGEGGYGGAKESGLAEEVEASKRCHRKGIRG